jgi:hypothetical protein
MFLHRLLVERLGVCRCGCDVSVTGSLVGTSGLLQSLSVCQVRSTSSVVGCGVVRDEVEARCRRWGGEKREHLEGVLLWGHDTSALTSSISSDDHSSERAASTDDPTTLRCKRIIHRNVACATAQLSSLRALLSTLGESSSAALGAGCPQQLFRVTAESSSVCALWL